MTVPIRKAMIFAAGFGKRLRPLTAYYAKPALPVMGRPLIEYSLRKLVREGFRDVVVNLHHRPESIAPSLESLSSAIAIRQEHEIEILGTAGGLKRAQRHFKDGPFLLMNGDTLVDFDLEELVRAHCDSKAKATLLLRYKPHGTDYTNVGLGRDGFVESLSGQRADEELMFAGVWILSPAIFDYLSGEPAGLERELLPRLVEERTLFASVQQVPWLTIDTPKRYWSACLSVARERIFEEDWAVESYDVSQASSNARVFGGPRVRVDASARFAREVVVGAGCRIRRGASLERAVCWDDVEIPAGTTLSNVVVTDGVKLAKGADVRDKVVMRVREDASELRHREVQDGLVVADLKTARKAEL